MKALLLGAGASWAAGYPLASELMAAIEREALNAGEAKLRDAWRGWTEYRQSTSDELQLLLFCPNPEVVLSVPDLCEAARDAGDLLVRRNIKRAFEREQPLDAQHINEYWDSSQRERLTEAIAARTRFLDCLHWYFALKHHRDAQPKDRRKRDYLHRLLSRLTPGDVVVTLNWDTTIERTLAEQGRWNPITGYGFEHALRVEQTDSDPLPLPTEVSRGTDVKVLKLHGCFGW